LALLALTLSLAGCDKCGNWFQTYAPWSLDACRSTTAPQQ
jgi:hypothetical protein